MKFDINKVYYAVNADELKIGSVGYFADTLVSLEHCVDSEYSFPSKLTGVQEATKPYVFRDEGGITVWKFFYLVEEPKEEEPKEEELCTSKELAQWLAQGNGFWCWCNDDWNKACFTRFDFLEIDRDEVVRPGVYLIRKWDDDEWRNPTREYMGLK